MLSLTPAPSWPKHELWASLYCRRIACEGKGEGKPSNPEEQSTGKNEGKKSSRTPGSRGPLRRFFKSLGGATIFGQKMYRVVGNVALLLLLGHLLPFGGRSPLTGEPPNISVEVRLHPLQEVSLVSEVCLLA